MSNTAAVEKLLNISNTSNYTNFADPKINEELVIKGPIARIIHNQFGMDPTVFYKILPITIALVIFLIIGKIYFKGITQGQIIQVLQNLSLFLWMGALAITFSYLIPFNRGITILTGAMIGALTHFSLFQTYIEEKIQASKFQSLFL